MRDHLTYGPHSNPDGPNPPIIPVDPGARVENLASPCSSTGTSARHSSEWRKEEYCPSGRVCQISTTFDGTAAPSIPEHLQSPPSDSEQLRNLRVTSSSGAVPLAEIFLERCQEAVLYLYFIAVSGLQTVDDNGALGLYAWAVPP